jgi:hypothetical protein
MAALRAAMMLPDQAADWRATVSASCDVWERHRPLLEQLRAIEVLEPGASVLVQGQRDDQRTALADLAQRLDRAGQLAPGLNVDQAAAVMRVITSVESFRELRESLTLAEAREALVDLAETLLVRPTGA